MTNSWNLFYPSTLKLSLPFTPASPMLLTRLMYYRKPISIRIILIQISGVRGEQQSSPRTLCQAEQGLSGSTRLWSAKSVELKRDTQRHRPRTHRLGKINFNFSGIVIIGDFVNLKIEAGRGQFQRDGSGGKGDQLERIDLM